MTEMIAGVDEAGVGPIAGPVVAAAVILNPAKKIYKLRDSKIISAIKREILFEKIMKQALAVSTGIATVEEIDQLNIHQATMLVMQRAIHGLSLVPALVLIDGRSKPVLELPARAIVDGDATEKSISAASIIAKVTRDRMMQTLHLQYPDYHFDEHKGYSTKQHQMLLKQHGPSPIHRRSFSIVKNWIEMSGEPNLCGIDA